jgi:hypothetical protein
VAINWYKRLVEPAIAPFPDVAIERVRVSIFHHYSGYSMRHPDFFQCAIAPIAALFLAIGASQPAKATEHPLLLDGAPVQEQLDSSDDFLVEDNSYIDVYTFTGQAGQRVIITMTSEALDSYLILLDPNGNSIAQDDDSAGNLDAQIDIVLPVDGVYRVYANSYSGGLQGAYTLQASIATAEATETAATSNQSRYFCDQAGDVPLTMARSRRRNQTFPLIQWTSDWAPAPYSPTERCQTVSTRLADIHARRDRLILTAGTLNNQPVVCVANSRDEARQGICSADGLILTAQTRREAEDLIRGLQTSFTQIVAGTSPDILPATNAREDTIPYIDLSDF